MTADEIRAIAKAVAAELAAIDEQHPRAMTLAQAAKYTGQGRHVIAAAVEQGKIPLLRGGRSWLVARVAIDAWLAGADSTTEAA